jgi:hypothetical protein
MNFDSKASDLWDRWYPKLTEDHSGAFGAVTARGEAQVLRLALLHAVMDPDATDIGVPHLEAALAIWEYCFDSARYIFGDAEADPEVNKLLAALRDRDLTLTDINGHKSTAAINEMLTRLQAAGRVTIREERSGPLGHAKTTVSLVCQCRPRDPWTHSWVWCRYGHRNRRNTGNLPVNCGPVGFPKSVPTTNTVATNERVWFVTLQGLRILHLLTQEQKSPQGRAAYHNHVKI